MKQIYILIAFLLMSVSIYAQCSFDSNDTGSITNTNFSSTSTSFNLNSQYGQSFTACGNGIINTIGIFSISTNSGITITIYEGAGNTGTNLGSVSSLSTTAATSINDRSLLDMSSASISLTAGQVYTFYATSGQIDSRLSNASIYSGGDAYSNNTLSDINDFLFSVDIIPSSTTCFPNTFSDFDTATAGNLTGLQTDTASTTVDCWDFTVNSNGGVTITLAGGGGSNPGGAGDHQVNLTRAGGNTNPLNSVSLKTNDNNAFRLNSVYVRPAFNPSGNPLNIIVRGLLNGNVVTGAEATYTNVSHNQWLLIDVSSNASFNNVDEIRFTQNTTADWASLSIDEIDITQPTLGINNVALETISLFPNPAKNTIQISNLKASQDYKIYNLLGQSVKQGTIENNQRIDVSNLVKGVYLIKFKNNTETLRFVKE